MDYSPRDAQPGAGIELSAIRVLPYIPFRRTCGFATADLRRCSKICIAENASMLAGSSHQLCAIQRDGRLLYLRRCAIDRLLNRAAANGDY